MVRRMPGIARGLGRLHARVHRLSRGRLGNGFAGATLLILRTSGRKTGRPRENPMLYLRDEGGYVVAASNGGSAHSPAWFHNMIDAGAAAADLIIRGRSTPVIAREADEAERERLWPLMDDLYDGFPRYREMTGRRIPLIILNPVLRGESAPPSAR